jgi:hypothetical protein
MGRFCEQVERYLAAFAPDQVRVIRFRDWIANPRATYLEILGFLGLDDDGRVDFAPINQGMTYRSRPLVRFILFPPVLVRKMAHLFKRATGLTGLKIYPVIHKTVKLLSTAGYKKQITQELRDEIRTCYAEDNRRLEERLRRTRATPPRRLRRGPTVPFSPLDK